MLIYSEDALVIRHLYIKNILRRRLPRFVRSLPRERSITNVFLVNYLR